MKISVGMVAACSKTARTGLASSAKRWNSDQLPSKSSEIHGTTQANAVLGNFARGSKAKNT
jgi:hypothetical protein